MKEFFKITKAHIWVLAIYLIAGLSLYIFDYHGEHVPKWLALILFWPALMGFWLWSNVVFPLLHHDMYSLLHSSACGGSNGPIAALQCVGFGIEQDIPPGWFIFISFIIFCLSYVYILTSAVRFLFRKLKK